MSTDLTIQGCHISVSYNIEPEHRTYDSYDPAVVEVTHLSGDVFSLLPIQVQDEILEAIKNS